jgi:RHS repeat-associated protein
MMDAVCLVNANARIYDPTIGRFMSADPTVPDSFDGQAFDRYSYVLGNPLRYTDPSGHDNVDESVNVPGQRISAAGGPVVSFDGGSGVGSLVTALPETADGAIEDVLVQAKREKKATPRHLQYSLSWLFNLLGANGQNGQDSQNGKNDPNGNMCGAILPNGQTVGDVIRQERAALLAAQQQELQAQQHGSDAPGYTSGYFAGIVWPHGPVDFNNNFRGQASASFLGQAGNFAYYSIGSGILPDFELDLGAGAYGVTSALRGQKSFSQLTGPMFSDASAASVRGAALASQGCPVQGH